MNFESELTKKIREISPKAAAFNRLSEIMEMLRSENGCPWDKEQNPHTLRSTLIEETFEAIDAISEDDADHVKEELGDVFFNLVFISRCYEESGIFSSEDSLNEICEKLIRRHPHVFGSVNGVYTSDEVHNQWEKIKETVEGRKSDSVLDSVPKSFPPLLKAYKLLKKAAKSGFDWRKSEDFYSKIFEEIDEVREAESEKDKAHIEEEMGDLILAVVNLSRNFGIDPNVALEKANIKFSERYKLVEKRMKKSNLEMKAENDNKMMEFWNEAKKKSDE